MLINEHEIWGDNEINDQNIVRQKNNVTTLISIVKYKEFQREA